MKEEKRALLAALISFGVLIGWYFWTGQERGNPSQQAAPAAVPSASPETLTTNPQAEGARVVASKAPRPQQAEQKVRKENSALLIEWTNRGGRLSKVELKGYHQTVDPKSPLIDLLSYQGEVGLPLVCDRCNFSLPDDVEYALVAETETSVTFEGRHGGLLVRKSYEWEPEGYLLTLRVTLENRSAGELRGDVGLGWRARQIPSEDKSGFFGFLKGPSNQKTFIYKLGQEVIHLKNKEQALETRGQVAWSGMEDRYFLVLLISRRLSSEDHLHIEQQGEWMNLALYPSEMTLSPRGQHEDTYSFYLGPKERRFLQMANVGLEETVDYGWFALIAIPILKLLQVFYKFIGNWGAAIILLTALFKILTNPLTVKSMKQMKEMQKLQPKLAQLKEKYGNDKQRLNAETMQLFRAHKVNPMGGCLPMALQMPIYIALYKVLYNSIEIYHAPFIGFYRDLSAPDPYFILPILLGVLMVAQQRLTPSASADPMQRQMMTIMPILFTGFMLFLPLGLVLYIFVNTLMSVVQQWMYQKGIRFRDLLKKPT